VVAVITSVSSTAIVFNIVFPRFSLMADWQSVFCWYRLGLIYQQANYASSNPFPVGRSTLDDGQIMLPERRVSAHCRRPPPG
jgi:hypothetical protein